jgi:hypothetical protein
VAQQVRRGLRLSNEQLEEVLALLKDADSVELKLTIPESDHRSALTALGIDPLEAQIRQVYFFDTPDLALNAVGVVVRGRRVQGRRDDSVIKLRPVVPNELPPAQRRSSRCLVEVDAMPGGYVCSASFKGTLSRPHVREVASGSRPVSALFSKKQQRFYAEHAPEGLDLDDLSTLGPITVLKLKFRPEGFGRKLVAEMWLYPDGSRILELSTKCAPAEGVQTALEARLFLERQGVDLSGEQQTKTKTALDHFSGLLKTSAVGAG